MDRNTKETMATELKEKFAKASITLFADYKGLKSSQADTLRRNLRAKQCEVRILKNNIGRLISKDGSMGEAAQGLMDRVVGPTLIAFAYGDPAATAKVLNDFAKEHEALKIKESLLGKTLLAPAEVTQLAELPSRDVLLAMLLGVLNGSARSFVYVLDQYAKKKGGPAEEPTQGSTDEPATAAAAGSSET
jgi:large subunit ribosomal protein L10